MKVIVERSKWLRGEGSGVSQLLRERDGKLCCVGFACLAAGFSLDQIRSRVTVSDLLNVEETGPPSTLAAMVIGEGEPEEDPFCDTGAAEELYGANDDPAIWASARETKVAELGQKVGLEFEFVD